MQLYPTLNTATLPGTARRRTPRYAKPSQRCTSTASYLADRWKGPIAFVEAVQRACYRAGLAERSDPASRPEADEHLLEWAADTRTLRWNLRRLIAYGGRAPGVDGVTPADLTQSDVEQVSEVLLAGNYIPSELRECQIPKADGTLRPLHIPTAHDRLVERSLLTVLEPRLDPLFMDSVHGFRPGRSPHTALAQALCLAELDSRWIWGAFDLQDAFHSLPHGRLVQVLKIHIGEGRLVNTLERIIARPNSGPIGRKAKRGIPQGAPLSPLFLNAYLDHFLDTPWRDAYPGMPLVRYADDLLIPCANSAHLHEATGHLRRILKPCGLKLKEDKTQDVDLTREAMTISYMSFAIQLVDNRAIVTIDNALWNSLALHLRQAAGEDETEALTRETVIGWVNYLGPAAHCMTRDERADVVERIRETVAQAVGDPADLPRNELLSRLHRAVQQWEKIKIKVIK